jgi:hypothetical protein
MGEGTMDIITQECQVFEFIICGIVIGSLCMLGLLGNTTSIVVLWKHKKELLWKHKNESATILLLQCLSAMDSLLLVTTLFVYTLPAVHTYTGAGFDLYANCEYIKIFLWPLAMIAHTAAIWLTVLVTIHRFCCIITPVGIYSKLNMHYIRTLIILVFTFSILYNLPRFFEHHAVGGTNSSEDNGNTTNNVRILGDSTFYQILYSNVLYFPVMYVIPLLSLMYLNSKLIKFVNKLKTRKAELTGHRCPEDHITLCIIVIVFTFVICQTPALINQILWAVTDHTDRECGKFHFYYTKISDVLVVINSSINFIIYCLFGKSFRTIFVRALCWNSRASRRNGRSVATGNQIAAQDTLIPLQDVTVRSV